MSQPGLPPRTMINRMATGHYIAQALHAVATLGIADLLHEGAKSADELARATDTHSATLYRLLRAVGSLGVFSEDEAGRFALTPMGEYLRADHPDSARAFAIVFNEPWFHRAWEGLLYSVRTGKPAFDYVHGAGFWEYLTQNPEAGALFDSAMTGGAAERGHALLAACELSPNGTIVDVGGGQGQLLAVVLGAYPQMRGVLFDQAHVLADAAQVLQDAGVIDRCELIAGNFLDSVPPGGDTYVLAQIVHDWDDEQAMAILQNCRGAMTEGNRLLLIERLVEPGSSNATPTMFGDLNMLVLFGARERTAPELDVLLQQAGFRLDAVAPANRTWHVVTGVAI